MHMPPLLRTKLRRKGFDLKELNLAITDCPLDLSRRAPNQVPVTKCKEKFCKDLIVHFSFAPKRCRSIKVFYPLPTKIFLYLYLYLWSHWSQQNIFTNQNLPVSVSLQKPILPDQSQISLATRISLYLYLYLFKNRFHPIKVKYCEIALVCMMQKFPALNITQTFGNLHSRD